MKIALASARFVNSDVEGNLQRIERAMAGVRGKADLICFGETFLQGFDALCWQYEKDRHVAVPREGEVMARLAALTQRYGVDLGLGYIERAEEKLYSSYIVLVKGQTAHTYRRISRGWKEFRKTDGHYAEGDSVSAFSYGGHTVTVALCGDLWDMPDRFRCDDLLLWPVYVDYSAAEWQREIGGYARQAALACPCTLMVNSLSDDPVSHGGAWVLRNGQVAQALPLDTEGVLIVDLP
ncbi:MAG: carbon-nitrogen hydrolase family protein [Clostridia bacterium]|nr:carbon-nitrogen hydrolase family protein [Clostridia bacterium]